MSTNPENVKQGTPSPDPSSQILETEIQISGKGDPDGTPVSKKETPPDQIPEKGDPDGTPSLPKLESPKPIQDALHHSPPEQVTPTQISRKSISVIAKETDAEKYKGDLFYTLADSDKQRAILTLEHLQCMSKWAEIVKMGGFTLAEFVQLRKISPRFDALAKEIQHVREEVHQAEREEVAHDRAVNGVSVPIFSQSGRLLGERLVPSDDLLKFMMKSANPDKYGEKGNAVQTGIVLNVNLGLKRNKE